MTNHIFNVLQQHGSVIPRVRVLNSHAYSPNLSHTEKFWHIIKHKQLKADYINEEWENILPRKLQQVVSSVPKRWILLKEKVLQNRCKYDPVETYLKYFAGIKF